MISRIIYLLLFTLCILSISCNDEGNIFEERQGGEAEFLGNKYNLTNAYQSYEGRFTSNGHSFHNFTLALTSKELVYDEDSGFDSSIKLPQGFAIGFDLTTSNTIIKTDTYKEYDFRSESQPTFDSMEIYILNGTDDPDYYQCEDGVMSIKVDGEKYSFIFEGRDTKGNIIKFNFIGKVREVKEF